MGERLFVGRAAEQQRLHARLEQSLGGAGALCLIAGEAGSGKTALIREFVRQVQEQHEDLVVVAGHCNAQTGKGEPYLPYMEILSILGGDCDTRLSKDSICQNNAKRLGQLARTTAKVLLEFAPDIVGAFVPGSSLIVNIGKSLAEENGLLPSFEEETAQKSISPSELNAEKIFTQYTALIANLASSAPLILVLDDLQWADCASIDLFSHLAAELRESRVLLVGTYRPNDIAMSRGDDERHPLVSILNEMKRCYGDIVIDLDVVQPKERQHFVDLLLDREPNRLDRQFREQLFLHTSGHPLFTVELLHSLKEEGKLVRDGEGAWMQNGELDWSVLPPRVEGVIEERIGRLEEKTREILTGCSIEGKTFTAQVVAHLHEMSEREMLKYLSQDLEKRHRLVKEGDTERIGRTWLSRFTFCETVFQQYLYNGLSEREKMILHGDVAVFLEELYKERKDAVLLQLARHYELAGELEKAAAYYCQGGNRALLLSAYAEAQRDFARCLELLDQAAQGGAPGLLQQELEAQLGYSKSVRSLEGWSSPKVRSCYERALTLSKELGANSLTAELLFGLWTCHLVNLELPQALEKAEALALFAEQAGDEELRVEAAVTKCNVLLWQNKLEAALPYAEQVFRMLPEEKVQLHVERFGQDTRIFAGMFMGVIQGGRGEEAEARETCRRMMEHAERGNHPFSTAVALQGATWTMFQLGRIEEAAEYAERLICHCAREGFSFYEHLGLLFKSWVLVNRREPEQAGSCLAAATEARLSKGCGLVMHSIVATIRAEIDLQLGDFHAGLARIEQAIAFSESHEELLYVDRMREARAKLVSAVK